MTSRCLVSLLALGALLAGPSAHAAEPAPRPFLRTVIGLTDGQLADMEQGKVVTKQLTTPEKAEIAAFGVVRVNGSVTVLRDKMRDFQKFRQVPQIPEIGRFSDTPAVSDLQGLTWPEDDIEALAKCKPGQCDVKVGTAGLQRIQREVDFKAGDAGAKASAVIKDLMAGYARAYRTGGTAAMGVTIDKSNPKALSNEFRTLMGNSTYLVQYVPAFNKHMTDYPKSTLADTTDSLIWTKDTFGLKPVVSMYHVTVHQPASGGLLAAIKTLYSSHYFNAALEMMAAVPTPDGKGFYLIDLYRTRIDPPTGMLSGVLMGKVKSGIEQGVEMNLTRAKSQVEGK